MNSRILTSDEFIKAVSNAATSLSQLAENVRPIEFPYMAIYFENQSPSLLATFYDLLLQNKKSEIRTLFAKNPPPQKMADRIVERIEPDGTVIEDRHAVAVSRDNVLKNLDRVLEEKYSDELSKKYLQRQARFYRGETETLSIDGSSHLNGLFKNIENETNYLEPFSCGSAVNVRERLAAIFSKKPDLTQVLAQDLVLAIFVGRDIAENKGLETTLHPTIALKLEYIATCYSAFLLESKIRKARFWKSPQLVELHSAEANLTMRKTR